MRKVALSIALCCLFLFATGTTVSVYAHPNDATVTFKNVDYLGTHYTVVENSPDTVHHIEVWRRNPTNEWVLEQTVSPKCSTNSVIVTPQQAGIVDYSLAVFDCENPTDGAIDSYWAILASKFMNPIKTSTVAGVVVPTDKLAILAPYLGIASVFASATVLASIVLRHVKSKSLNAD